jgi:hypothetical protein
VTRRRRRPDRVAVHRASGSGEEEVQGSEHALGVAGGVARRGVMAHGGCASERAAQQQQQQQHRTNGPGASSWAVTSFAQSARRYGGEGREVAAPLITGSQSVCE